MIKESDNTATNILKRELGGEKAYRILIKQYTKYTLAEEFNTENVTSAKYSLDVLKRLYKDQEKYKDLIKFDERIIFRRILKEKHKRIWDST